MTDLQHRLRYYQPERSADDLWQRLNSDLADMVGATSILYAFTHSPELVRHLGFTSGLIIRHNHPAEYVTAFGEANFLDDDPSCSGVLVTLEPFLWTEAVALVGKSAENPQRDALDVSLGMHVGATCGFSFAQGLGIGGVGMAARWVDADDFAARFQPKAQAVKQLIIRFDAVMRPKMVAETFQLAPREREVLALSAAGMSGKQIADELDIATKTVFSTTARARKSLKAANNMEAIAKALVYGLL